MEERVISGLVSIASLLRDGRATIPEIITEVEDPSEWPVSTIDKYGRYVEVEKIDVLLAQLDELWHMKLEAVEEAHTLRRHRECLSACACSRV